MRGVAGEGVVELDDRLTVCRDAAKGQCRRPLCKYYHIPIPLPPAPVMAALTAAANTTPATSSVIVAID